jgi:uncharacterized protein with FMN-binding domain
MRRAIVSSTATVSGIILLLGLKSQGGTASQAAGTFSIGTGTGTVGAAGAPSTAPSTSSSSSPSTGSSSSPSTGSSSTSKAAATATKTVTGTAADTRYGPVQVKVTFTGTKISKIDVVQYPTESGRDQQINSYALPILNQEAMTAQSAQIDAVSGATFTSDGYTQSLQSAIDQARA